MDSPSSQRRNDAPADGRVPLEDTLRPVGSWVRSRFTVDARALAALRVALGLIILIDLLHRAGDLALFYTDAGVYPTSLYETTYPRYTGTSIHAASGALWFQQLLFAVAGLLAVLLVVGYRSRLVAGLSFVLLYSLHARNPAVLNGGDQLLRVLLFVAILSPLGERWSVDALRRGSARQTVTSVATAALLVQPLAVFTANAVQKHAGDTWFSGDALRLALASDTMTILLGNHLGSYPALLEVLNWAWVILLSGSVLWLLCTGGRVRALAVFAFVGAFSGMLVTMAVGLFPLVLTASVLPFLPRTFWDAVARRVPSDVRERLPKTVPIEGLDRPPVERRALAALRQRGSESAATFAVDYAHSLRQVAGVLVVVWIVVYSAGGATGIGVPSAAYSPHLDHQGWGLYAPDPPGSYSWFVVEAELADGTRVDALDGGPLDLGRPPDPAREYDTFRHRKYMESVRRSARGEETGPIARRYAAWACEAATRRHGESVERVRIHWLFQPDPLDDEVVPHRDYVLVQRDCNQEGSTSLRRGGPLGDGRSPIPGSAGP